MDRIWFNLGQVLPDFDGWKSWPRFSNLCPLVRLSFTRLDGSPMSGTYTNLLLRRRWELSDEGRSVVELAQFLYPQEEQIILVLPPSTKLLQSGFTQARWEARLGYRTKDAGKSEIRYSVLIEETGSLEPWVDDGEI